MVGGSLHLWIIVVIEVVGVLNGLLERIFARLQRISDGKNLALASDGNYYVHEGEVIRMFCYCTNDSVQNSVESLDLTLQDSARQGGSGCGTVQADVTINTQDEGYYGCRARLTDGSVCRTRVGNVQILRIPINAPSPQFGLLNALATLNCSINGIDATFVSITWTNPSNTTPQNGRIDNVDLSHEGQYTCEVFLSQYSLVLKGSVQFIVIVPPTLINDPQNILNFTSNHRQCLNVIFKSKYGNQTHISWYKDNRAIQDSNPGRNDSFDDYSNSRTQMTFNPIRRSDSGNYQVVIENTHNIIPNHMRRIETSFTVSVTILPVKPTNLRTQNVTSKSAYLTWDLNNMTTDDAADRQTVLIYYHNGSVALENTLWRGEERILLPLIPDMRYRAVICSFNQDGYVTSEEYTFYTPVGAPLISEITVTRVQDRNNTLYVVVVLAYTGGGSITHFKVSLRYIGTTEWISLPDNFTASRVDNSMLWGAYVTVSDERFQCSGVDLKITAVNSEGHRSQVVEHPFVLPGAPLSVELVSSSFDSVVILLALPLTGTTPFTHLEVEFHSPENNVVNITKLDLELGNTEEVTLSDLQDGTVYVVSMSIYNCGGKGMPSQQIEIVTMARPPLATHGIALVTVCGGVLLVTMVIVAVVIWKKYSNDKRKEREYVITEESNKPIPRDHDHPNMVKRTNSSPISPASPSPPTPSTATSVLSPTQSSPGFYHSSAFPSAPMCNALPNGLGHTLNHASYHSSFKFDAGTSRCNSFNQESDTSESNSPRYTYTFPRSGEGTPHIGHAYDQIDLPHDQILFDHVRSSDIHNSHTITSKDVIIASKIPVASGSGARNKVRDFTDPDSPQLRTQSTHSVATTATQLTTSDTTISTRDSLLFPRIETNTTDV